MTVGLVGHPRLTFSCSEVPHVLAGEVVGGAGFAAAGSQPSCGHPPPSRLGKALQEDRGEIACPAAARGAVRGLQRVLPAG